MDQSAAVTAIAHQIQLAVAPVFLLAGIGGFLNVLTHRLARVVDRSRYIETMAAAEGDSYALELKLLDRRMAVVNLAIACFTAGALLVCAVVAILFVADLAKIAFAQPIALLFILAMLLLIAGLMLFLYEVRLATQGRRLSRRLRQERRGS
jgi:ABC-type multidrug transport system fused ATPase/permease subunit